MAVLNWGKPLIELAPLGASDAIGAYVATSTPQENSAQLTTTKGDKKEAKEEGGGVVDTKYNKSGYSFVFKLFVKKGETRPIPDEDGVILTNYAVRMTPEDTTTTGFLMEKTAASVVETWSSDEGSLLEYTFDGLVPPAGKILKPYTAP
jgi:hypothetical protein